MDEKNYGFVMMVKGCKPLVCAIIDEHRSTFETAAPAALPGITFTEPPSNASSSLMTRENATCICSSVPSK